MDSRSTAAESDIEAKFWNREEAKSIRTRQSIQARRDSAFKIISEAGIKLTTRRGLKEDIDKKLETRKKVQRHHDALRSRIGFFIQNHLPIRLLQVSDFALVERSTLQEQISEKVTKGFFVCDKDACLCFEKIKQDLKYSILSHRWGSRELTFGDFGKLHEHATQNNSTPSDPTKKMQDLWGNTPFKDSLTKLLHFRDVSSQRQCKYAWVDTICINKESSAELDESIRSMFTWYRDSHICVVHLNQTVYSLDMEDDPWFTRGWTLQELLAPRRIKFFSASWKGITRRQNDKDIDGTEEQAAKAGQDNPPLWSTIKTITGIPIDDLLDFKPGLYDIGKRMNWASKRTTTRVEDMAYCMIGIFRVNLSIAYGEKEGAFYRLQAEIMQNSDDQSLFDWRGRASAYNTMFAASPECFSRALGVPTDSTPPIGTDHTSTSVANFERRVSRVLYHKSELPSLGLWRNLEATAFTILSRSPNKPGEYILMLLEQIGDQQRYKRLDLIETKLEQEPTNKDPYEIYIK